MSKAMNSLAAYYVAALKGLEQEKSRLDEEIRQVRSLLARHTGVGAKASNDAAPSAVAKKPRKKRELSAAARARIAAAQKKRWADFRKGQKG